MSVEQTKKNPAGLQKAEDNRDSDNGLVETVEDEQEEHPHVRQTRLIEQTLASFGVVAQVAEINAGPTVTQFGLRLGVKTKARRVSELVDDLALALAVPSVRVELPIPGKSLVGLEVPNPRRETVGLADLMATDEFKHNEEIRLKFAVGRGLAGQPIVADLSGMPHLLIAGATNSGKSVCLNALIACFLAQYGPEELRLMLVDPKLVELVGYNGLPHLIFPVITQMQSVAGPGVTAAPGGNIHTEQTATAEVVPGQEPDVLAALVWLVAEMERRYRHLARHKFRNIQLYNQQAARASTSLTTADASQATKQSNQPHLERLPYIVLIVDELADLMMTAPQAVEGLITRLAQKARAVGIHLVLATQRPSAEVVTGLIKANFPSRIAFAVTSQIESRVILDRTGAEALLGQGDMLFVNQGRAPVRVQGAYISDPQIEEVVGRWHSTTLGAAGEQQVYNYSWLHEPEPLTTAQPPLNVTPTEQSAQPGQPPPTKNSSKAGGKTTTSPNKAKGTLSSTVPSQTEQHRLAQLEVENAGLKEELAQLRQQLATLKDLKVTIEGLPHGPGTTQLVSLPDLLKLTQLEVGQINTGGISTINDTSVSDTTPRATPVSGVNSNLAATPAITSTPTANPAASQAPTTSTPPANVRLEAGIETRKRAAIETEREKLNGIITRVQRMKKLHRSILYLLQQHEGEEMTISQMAVWLQYTEKALSDQPPLDLIKLQMLARRPYGRSYKYKSNLAAFAASNFKYLEAQHVIAQIIRNL